jgi:hypothetical protein
MRGVISETTNTEARQFDFLEDEWNAICHFPLPDGSWGEGPGSLKASKVLDGCVFLEFFEGPYLMEIDARSMLELIRCWGSLWAVRCPLRAERSANH